MDLHHAYIFQAKDLSAGYAIKRSMFRANCYVTWLFQSLPLWDK